MRAERAAASGAGYRGRQGVDAERIEDIKRLYGFNKPAPERFVQMLGQFARFDLGQSFFHHKDGVDTGERKSSQCPSVWACGRSF